MWVRPFLSFQAFLAQKPRALRALRAGRDGGSVWGEGSVWGGAGGLQRKKGVGGCRRPLWEEQRLFGGGEAIAGGEGSPLELGEESF